MSAILGIYGYDARRPTVGCRHNSGAVLLQDDGTLSVAVEEERLSRIKNDHRYPLQAVECVLAQGAAEVVAVAGWPRHRYLGQALSNYRLWASEAIHGRAARHFWNRAFDFPFHALGAAYMGLPSVPDSLATLPKHTVRHHDAHAATAYYTCPWPDTPVLVITLDGAGDAESGGVWLGEAGHLTRLCSIPHPHSLGFIYSAITAHLGFTPHRHEGKVLGLAAFADGAPLGEKLLQHLHFADGYPQLDRLLLNIAYGRFAEPTILELVAGLSREEIAAGVQYFTEAAVLPLVQHWVAQTGAHRLALAGGVFANVKLNQRVLQLEVVENIYIYPNMGDGGLAAGAALATLAKQQGKLRPRAMDSVYLGQDISSDAAEAALGAAQVAFTQPSDLAGEVAELLAHGKVVARAAGRMEYGPRALGNRTLFASCGDQTINQWLNDKLQRTEFMPFAPIIMEEYAAEYFPEWRPEQVAARFMTLTYDASDVAKAKIPAAIHVDGTARPQVLRRKDNPAVYAILEAYHARTGVPALINTSFNMHEEPIVCTASDAVRAFQLGHLDALICADLLAVAQG
ncbi:MAG: carbamoyltransferase C-terminal domain-containing protein [Mariprofundales bacterium]|nr:carbamoyltransferase C-terminal domain-containing protein [Mariprofundales bacterium]